LTFALLVTAWPVSALGTSLTARVTHPAWAAKTRAVDMVTVGRVLTCAQVAASRPMIQDRTMSMAVTSRVSGLAKAFSCPRMTELCVVLVAGADQGALGAVQLLPLAYSLPTGLPLPA